MVASWQDLDCDDMDNAYLRDYIRRLEAVREAAKAALQKRDEIENSRSYQGIFLIALMHGYEYEGPTWEKEDKELRAALDAAKEA